MSLLGEGFRLEELRVEAMSGTVSGPGGREKLDPKVMDVLVHMAEHAGQVVLRDDLLARLWPNAVVTDDVITRCFYELRRCLSRAGGSERYRNLLETVPKRGYRLNATVRPLPPPETAVAGPEEPPRRLRSWLRAITTAAALVAVAIALYLWRSPEQPGTPTGGSAPHAIAVLPFLDMSESGDQGYLSDGFAEEILNSLSQSQDLRVIARTSSFALRGQALDVPQIAAKLNVSHVLEGSVRKSGSRVRVTAQLIDALTNSHVWSQTYDRGLGDLFAIQDDIAASVAAALEVTLSRGELRGRAPPSIEAYERYLRGQLLYGRRGPDDLRRAAQYYEEAVALDADYAGAWAALSGAYGLMVHMGELPPERGQPLQRDAALRAVELDPELAVAQNRLARYYFDVGDRAKGLEHGRLARALDPDDPLVLGGQAGVATWQEDHETALAIQRRVAAMDPLSPLERGNLASDLMATGRYDEALAEYRAARELNPGRAPEFDCRIAQLHVLLKRLDQADAVVESMPPGEYHDRAQALLHRLAGRQEAADAALARLVSSAEQIPGVAVAEIYAYRGMQDEAMEALETARQALERMPALAPEDSWRFQIDLRTSPFLAPLRAHPRWQALKDEYQ